MKLALLISSLNSGGAQRVLANLANYWSTKGHEVFLITLADQNSESFYHLDPQINLIQLNQSSSEKSYLKRTVNILKRLSSIRKTIKKINPDIIISFVDKINITTILATYGLKIPVIASEHTTPQYRILPYLYKKLRDFTYKKARHVTVLTKTAAKYFKKLNNIVIIPNPVPKPKEIKHTLQQQVQTIISAGRLHPVKRYDLLIQAFANLINRYTKLKLVIYGEGNERNNLETLITKLNLTNKVFLPGTTKDINKALLEADLFIFPSKYEGFPNALCEAMAVGLPVIASNCSGNIDIVRDKIDGRLFPVGDVETLTNIATELIEDHKQRQQLAENAKTVCDRFNANKIFTMWDKLISL